MGIQKLILVIYTSSLFCNFTWFLQGLMIFQTRMNRYIIMHFVLY